MIAMHPYLTFNGNCEAAFNFYKKIFGGDFDTLSRFGEMPQSAGLNISDSDKQKIMHVSLPITEGYTLMGSDTSEHYGTAVIGTNVTISITAESTEEADHLYAQLSEEGKATMPMENTFWESYFGMCTDRFGVQWMVSADPQ